MSTDPAAPTTWLTREAHARLTSSLETMQTDRPAPTSSPRSRRPARRATSRRTAATTRRARSRASSRPGSASSPSCCATSRRHPTPPGDVVEEGCVVAVDYGDDDVERFLFANRENATDEGGKVTLPDGTSLDVYSPESPIGQAIRGHRAGDDGRVRAAGSLAVTVVSVEPYDG